MGTILKELFAAPIIHLDPSLPAETFDAVGGLIGIDVVCEESCPSGIHGVRGCDHFPFLVLVIELYSVLYIFSGK